MFVQVGYAPGGALDLKSTGVCGLDMENMPTHPYFLLRIYPYLQIFDTNFLHIFHSFSLFLDDYR